MSWDPAQYLKFADHRLRPAIDLLGRIDAAAPREVYDLGAGAGNVTRLLKQRWPQARVTGFEESEAMLAKAATVAPEITWERANLSSWTAPRPADVIYSNAALHWLDDHARLFPALLGGLAPGGVLAVQMPRNFEAPSHTSIWEAARSGPWRTRLEPLLRTAPTGPPSFYFDVLAPRTGTLDIWETEYQQVLEGAHPVAEWTKGTWLRPLLDALEEPERSQFEAAYIERVDRAYPPRADGRTLFPFRRIFIVATAKR